MSSRPVQQQKPRVFVGSSREAKESGIVEEFVNMLGKDAYMIPWWDSPEFKPMRSILSGLMDAVNKRLSSYDFGLFILTADDVLISRRRRTNAARDNVLFELGLFLGAFGPTRTFAVIQTAERSSQKVKTPIDLWGIIVPPFETSSRKRMKESIRTAAQRFRRFIKETGPRPLEEKLVTKGLEWKFSWMEKAFKVTVPEEMLRENQSILEGKKLVLVAMQTDYTIDAALNSSIALSAVRAIGPLPETIIFRAPNNTARKNIFSNITKGVEVQGRVFVIPAAFEIKRGMVIKDLLMAGGEFAFGGACDT